MCGGGSQGREDNTVGTMQIEKKLPAFVFVGLFEGEKDRHNYNTIITQTHIVTVLPECQLKSEKKTFFLF